MTICIINNTLQKNKSFSCKFVAQIDEYRKQVKTLFAQAIHGLEIGPCRILTNRFNILLEYKNITYTIGSINTFLNYGLDKNAIDHPEQTAESLKNNLLQKLDTEKDTKIFRRTGSYVREIDHIKNNFSQVVKKIEKRNKPGVVGWLLDESPFKRFEEGIFLSNPDRKVYFNEDAWITANTDDTVTIHGSSSAKTDLYAFLISQEYETCEASYTAGLNAHDIYPKSWNNLIRITIDDYYAYVPTIYDLYKKTGRTDLETAINDWFERLIASIHEQQNKDEETAAAKLNELKGHDIYRDIYTFVKNNADNNTHVSVGSVVKELRGKEQKNYDYIKHIPNAGLYADISEMILKIYITDMLDCNIIKTFRKTGAFGSFFLLYAAPETEWILNKTSDEILDITRKLIITDDDANTLLKFIQYQMHMNLHVPNEVLESFVKAINCCSFIRTHKSDFIQIMSKQNTRLPDITNKCLERDIIKAIKSQRKPSQKQPVTNDQLIIKALTAYQSNDPNEQAQIKDLLDKLNS